MNLFMQRFWGALKRIFPGCVGQSQAVAFNMFLAVFPMMLLVLGVVASAAVLRDGFLDIVGHLQPVLPPGQTALWGGFLRRPNGAQGWRLISLGLGGTLLAGVQMMRLFITGFQMVHKDRVRLGFANQTLRALVLLVVTILPWVAAANLIVFAKQARNYMDAHAPESLFLRGVWALVYFGIALGLAMIALAVIYRIGRPGVRSWSCVLPGAVVATLLWWIVSAGYGLYMRHVPYGAIYGGLAATIGFMLWMQLTATIVLLGDAYNAERLESRSAIFRTAAARIAVPASELR